MRILISLKLYEDDEAEYYRMLFIRGDKRIYSILGFFDDATLKAHSNLFDQIAETFVPSRK